MLQRIKERADSANVGTVAYISMAFGNPYSDPWNEEIVSEAAAKIASVGVGAISLADTVGLAEPELISRVMKTVTANARNLKSGFTCTARGLAAAAKVLAAYDAGCRRFDSALGGLGGCPFAQDQLVGNIPTEELLRALEQRGVKLENPATWTDAGFEQPHQRRVRCLICHPAR